MRIVSVEYVPQAGQLFIFDWAKDRHTGIWAHRVSIFETRLVAFHEGDVVCQLVADLFLIDPAPETRRRVVVYEGSRVAVVTPEKKAVRRGAQGILLDYQALALEMVRVLGSPVEGGEE